MIKLLKYAVPAAAILSMTAGFAGAALLTPPSYSDIVNTTSTAFGGSLLTDLLPWAGILLLITLAGMVLAAIIRRVLGAIAKIVGGRRRGGRGRRRFR